MLSKTGEDEEWQSYAVHTPKLHENQHFSFLTSLQYQPLQWNSIWFIFDIQKGYLENLIDNGSKMDPMDP